MFLSNKFEQPLTALYDVEEVIEVDELNEGNLYAAAGKQVMKGQAVFCHT